MALLGTGKVELLVVWMLDAGHTAPLFKRLILQQCLCVIYPSTVTELFHPSAIKSEPCPISMSVGVQVYASIYLCIYISVDLCMYLCIYASMSVCMSVTYVGMYVGPSFSLSLFWLGSLLSHRDALYNGM